MGAYLARRGFHSLSGLLSRSAAWSCFSRLPIGSTRILCLGGSVNLARELRLGPRNEALGAQSAAFLPLSPGPGQSPGDSMAQRPVTTGSTKIDFEHSANQHTNVRQILPASISSEVSETIVGRKVPPSRALSEVSGTRILDKVAETRVSRSGWHRALRRV
jgi:hypothetical protein